MTNQLKIATARRETPLFSLPADLAAAPRDDGYCWIHYRPHLSLRAALASPLRSSQRQ